MNMKKFYKIILILIALPLLAIACGKDDLKYEQGAAEDENCYGVYFPTQDLPSEFDPSDPCVVTVKASRTNAKGNITVPVEIKQSEGNVFSVAPITFEDGQTETTFDITFPDAELGTEYSITVSVTDPQYAKVYGVQKTFLDINLSRVKWDPVKDASGASEAGIALYRDDFFTTFFGVSNVEYKVEVQENAGKPGIYRLKNVYGEAYPYNEPGDWDDSKDYYLIVNAEDPECVYISTQATGCDWSYGVCYVSSIAGLRLAQGKTKDEVKALGAFGTLSNGVITFPKGTLLFGMADYNNGGLYTANKNGMFRIILPGGKPVDYSFGVSSGLTKDGKVPVSFTLGADITKVIYKVFEGSLDKEGIQEAHYDVISAKDAQEVTESKTVAVSCAKTGVYTLVAVAYDKDGVKKGYDGTSFGFVASGDEEAKATVISAGLELTSRYEATGNTKRNSCLVYAYGKDITDIKMGLYLSDDNALNNLDSLAASMKSLSAENIAAVNGEGFADMFTKLSPVTDYTLVVWATNGFTTKIVTDVVTTEGLPRMDLGEGAFTYGVFFTNDGKPSVDKGLTLQRDPNYENTYIIPDWGYGVDFEFTYDPTTGKVFVPAQFIGYVHPSYGEVNVGEVKNVLGEKHKDYDKFVDSSYDPESHTFKFCVAYYCKAGTFGWGIETFTLDNAIEFTQTAGSPLRIKANIPDVTRSLPFTITELEKVMTCGSFAGLDVIPSLKTVRFNAVDHEARRMDKSFHADGRLFE